MSTETFVPEGPEAVALERASCAVEVGAVAFTLKVTTATVPPPESMLLRVSDAIAIRTLPLVAVLAVSAWSVSRLPLSTPATESKTGS